MSENLLTFSTLELLLAGITGVLFIIQILYYLVTYARPLRTAKTTGSTEQATVDKEAHQSLSLFMLTANQKIYAIICRYC